MSLMKKYLIAEIEKLIPYGINECKIFEQLVQIKTKSGENIQLFDPMLHFMKSAKSDMVGQKKKMIISSSAEKIGKTIDKSPRIIRIFNKEPGRPSDRLIMVAKIIKIFEKSEADYGTIIVDAGFGNIWLGVSEAMLCNLRVKDFIKVETSHLELYNILD